jgi:hypothetical protein
VDNGKMGKLGTDLAVKVYTHNGKEFVHRPGGGGASGGEVRAK